MFRLGLWNQVVQYICMERHDRNLVIWMEPMDNIINPNCIKATFFPASLALFGDNPSANAFFVATWYALDFLERSAFVSASTSFGPFDSLDFLVFMAFIPFSGFTFDFMTFLPLPDFTGVVCLARLDLVPRLGVEGKASFTSGFDLAFALALALGAGSAASGALALADLALDLGLSSLGSTSSGLALRFLELDFALPLPRPRPRPRPLPLLATTSSPSSPQTSPAFLCSAGVTGFIPSKAAGLGFDRSTRSFTVAST